MEKLYPLLMTPEFDPRPWGTLDLSPIYPEHRCKEKIGEAWLTGDHCKIANGALAGQRLDEVSKKFGRALVGEAARDAHRARLLPPTRGQTFCSLHRGAVQPAPRSRSCNDRPSTTPRRFFPCNDAPDKWD